MQLSDTPENKIIEKLNKENKELRRKLDDLTSEHLQSLEIIKTGIPLFDREELYRTIFDSIDEGYCLIEMYIEPNEPLDYRFIEVNAAFEKQSTLKNATGKWMRELKPYHEEYWFEIYRDVAITGKSINFENVGKYLDNRWFLVNAFKIGSSDQKMVAILFKDITDRKKTEGTLLKSEERYRDLVESANSIILRIDSNGTLKFVNEYSLQFFGYTREEMIGENIKMIVPVREYSGKDLSDLVANVLSEPHKYVQVENENVRKDGEHVWINWTNRAIRDEKGNLLEILSIGNDITTRKKAEAALLVEHNILEAVINNIGVGFVVADFNGNILSLNNAALKIHDFRTSEDILSRLEQFTKEFELEYPDGTKVPPEDWPLAQAIRGEYTKDLNVKLIQHKNQSIKNISYTSVPIYDTYHNKMLIVLTLTDYTDIYKRSEELAKERELFESIFNNIPVMITVFDPEQKKFRFNKEYINVLGWAEDDTTDGNMSKAFPDPEYRKKVAEYTQSLESGWKEWIVTAKDGEKIPSSWANILLTSRIMIGIGIDLRNIREAEEKLRESEQRLQVIFNNVALGIVEIDAQNRFLAVNDRACEILGYTREDFMGKRISDITAIEDTDRSNDLNTKLIQGDYNIFDYEKRYIKKDGTLLWVHVTVSAIRNSYGQFLNSIGTFEDISKRKEVEQALTESEEMFVKMFQSIPVGVALTTPDKGIYFKVNDAWLNMMNYPVAEEVIGKTPLDLGLVADPEQFNKILGEFQTKDTIRDAELTIYTKTQHKKVISINMDLISISGNKFIITSNTDITERKNSDAAIKRSVTILKQAGSMASLGAWEIEFQHGPDDPKLRWSDQVYRIFGFTPGSINVTNKLFFEFVHPDDRSKIRDVLTRSIKEKSPYSIEHRIIRFDGVERKVIEHAEIFFDDSGRAIRVIGAIQDITEQKIEQEKLKESEEKFRSLFENITEGVALHELVYKNDKVIDYKIIDINPAFMDITGIDPEKARGALASQLYNMKDPPYLKEYAEVAMTGKPLRFDTFYEPMNRHFIISAISPKKGQFATVFEDVTEQKKNEFEIKQRNEELTRFIYTVSHDLKSPLVTIKSFTSYLKEDIDNQDKTAQDKDIGYIQNAADKMGKLLDELLELTRIGRQEKYKTAIPLSTVVQSALDLVAGYISRKNIKVQFVGPSVELYGHPQRFIQLYQNLLDNAAKFMGDHPEPLIEIGAYTDKKKNNEVVLFVRDNGSGIDPRYRHKIFGLFEKMDTKTEGTGIGLALVKRIVEVHNGTIWFESEGTGKGTTFYFTLERTQIIN